MRRARRPLAPSHREEEEEVISSTTVQAFKQLGRGHWLFGRNGRGTPASLDRRAEVRESISGVASSRANEK
eukprot:5487027-Pyramimonas_sp.AAC.1